MNRYRNAPGARTGTGPSKATASTLCQKCLQRDMYSHPYSSRPYCLPGPRHYSYECKATTQQRPYISRPSRTQQLQNPDLVPKLTYDAPKSSDQISGLADEILAKQERERGRQPDSELDDDDDLSRRRKDRSPKRRRSASLLSSASVSTISTDRSRSRSPDLRDRESNSRRKRQYSHSSSDKADSPMSAEETQSPNIGRDTERNIRRKRQASSPDERGRQRGSPVRGSRKGRSPSQSRERSRIARERRSMTPDAVRSHDVGRRPKPQNEPVQRRRERSLSPFSKRLALTQAMNMGR
ncbi:uncharacterized protein TRUGW13939_03239 [Talaromyces rugulosus]|uniref:Uncharacterized protein n=1 Tax=Talaromyces rugulosus TaxID=121627 RepID=A0A7H8QQK2_TALRU|nr:uncharacterized protein TRUGW13939_03239 [Talaromyces rugulosus]QKX56139.1 hypothetical protein TRUGW13939_03239 [Talaromyces rugulosus]